MAGGQEEAKNATLISHITWASYYEKHPPALAWGAPGCFRVECHIELRAGRGFALLSLGLCLPFLDEDWCYLLWGAAGTIN